MSQDVVLSGMTGRELVRALRTVLNQIRPRVIGLATAYVSVAGIDIVRQLLIQGVGTQCRLVAGIDGAVTHPQALAQAQRMGWSVRVVSRSGRLFHPKLFVGGRSFSTDGEVVDPTVIYLGSANLTLSGLQSEGSTA